MGSNTAWTPWTPFDGMWYRVRQTAVGDIEWEVVDFAYGSVPGGTGRIIGGNFQAGVSAAIDFIQNADDDEYFEDPEIGGDFEGYLEINCYKIEIRNTTRGAGIGMELYVWRVRNINNEVIYTQSYPQAYIDATADAMGYVKSLPEQEGCNGKGNGNGNGNGNGLELDEESDALRIAGIFVVGVAKGTLMAIIPIVAMSVSVAFMRKMVRKGTEVGS